MKVFGIGLNKTGTTSLGICLQQLGFRHTSFSLPLLEQLAMGEIEPLLAVVAAHDSFEDWPYPLAFAELDRHFPGSRFILTRRSSPERWLASLSAHALRTNPQLAPRARSLTYGYPFPQLHTEHHLKTYTCHLQQVRSYFQGRADALLEVCWEEQASWEPLCTFLNCAVPDAPFPHANPSQPADPLRERQNLALLAWYQQRLATG